MLSEHERDQLLQRQARVYEVLDVATKPAQWLIGGIKLLFLLLVVAVVCIIGPIWTYMHGGSFSGPQFWFGCFILGFIMMFFGAPWYTMFWGAVIFVSLFWWDINKDYASGNLFLTVVWTYEAVGLLWVLTKIACWVKKRRRARAEEYAEFHRIHPDLYEQYPEFDKWPMISRWFAFGRVQDARRARGEATTDHIWSPSGRRIR